MSINLLHNFTQVLLNLESIHVLSYYAFNNFNVNRNRLDVTNGMPNIKKMYFQLTKSSTQPRNYAFVGFEWIVLVELLWIMCSSF